MTKLLTRILSIFFFELILFTSIFFILYRTKLVNWEYLWMTKYWNLPVGVLFFTLLFVFSISIASWSMLLVQQKEEQLVQALQNLLKNNTNFLKKNSINSSLQKSLNDTRELISTQRKSLQKLTNDKAENQDQIIQERIIQERQRLARELHDSVSQQLFAASMLLSTINETKEDLPAYTKKIFLQTEQIIQQAQLEMRALLLHLRPVALKNKSLKRGLEDLIAELQQKISLKMTYRLEEVHLTKGAEDHLFRIAQETLSNTLRHAKATELDVLLVERNHRIIFRVKDNGIGFDTGDEKAGAYGLHNLEERAVEIGGLCKIVSVPSQGTVVEIQIPLEKET